MTVHAVKLAPYKCFIHTYVLTYLLQSRPLTSTWPHLISDVGLKEGGILTELSLCYIVLCSISVVHNRKSSSFRFVYWIWL